MAGWRWKQVGVALAILAANALVTFRVIGVHYQPFSWQAFAQVYDPPANPHGVDSDDDGIPDMHDPNPQVPDPSGCFYDPATGEILSGSVSVQVIGGSGGLVALPPVPDGCYLIKLNQIGQPSANPASQQATVIITVTGLPNGCYVAPFCPFLDETFVASNSAQADILGALPDLDNPGFLESPGCTPGYQRIVLNQTSVGVLGNNIAVSCPSAAPVLSPWAIPAVGMMLAAVGLLALRRMARRV